MPKHARRLNDEFGFGLGIGTAQGREAKVPEVKLYCRNTLLRDMYRTIFRHEYMSLVKLGKEDPQHGSY